MQVRCPGCKRAYKVDDHRIPETGLKMRCPKCQTAFKVVKKASSAPAEPTRTGVEKNDTGSRLAGLSPKRPGQPSSVPPGPSMPAIPMPEPPKLPKKAPPPVPARETGAELDLDTRSLPEEDFGDIDVSALPSEPPRKFAAPPPRRTALTGEFDPLSPSADDKMADPAGIVLTGISDIPEANVSEPPDDFLADLDDTGPSAERQEEPPEISDSFDLSDLDSAPSSFAPDAGDLISLPPESDAPYHPTNDAVEEEEEAPAADTPDSIPSLALVDNSMLSHDSEAYSNSGVGRDFGEIDFDSTLAKSDALDMHLTDDLDLEPPQAQIDAETTSYGTGEPLDFGNVGIPSLESTPPTSPPRPPSFSGRANESMPPALNAYDIDDDVDLASIPSPADLLDDRPPSIPSSTNEKVAASGSTDFGEISLSPSENDGAGGLDIDDGGEFDAFPTQSKTDIDTSDSRVDLAADPMSLRYETGSTTAPEEPSSASDEERRPATAFEGRRKFERQSRRGKVAALALLVLVVLAGGSLTFTDMGPFGANIIYQLIPKTTNKAAVTAIEKTVAGLLQEDTPAAITSAIKETGDGFREYPGSETLQLLDIYLNYLVQIRFGPSEKNDKEATRVLGSTNLDESTSPYAPLAKTAQYVRFSRKLTLSPTLIGALKKTPEGTALLAELYLSENNPAAALQAAKALDAKESSPRSARLLGLALMEQGDAPSIAQAITQLKKAHQAHKGYPDLTLLLIEAMLSQKSADRDEIRQWLKAVMESQKTPLLPVQKARAHALEAKLAVIERRFTDAEASIRTAEKQGVEDTVLALVKGQVSLVRKDLSTAEMSFNKVLGETPNNLEARLGALEADIRSGSLAESRKALADIVKTHKESAYAHYLIGEIDAALQDIDPAIKSLETAVALDDTLLEAYISLSNLYIAKEENRKAMDILDKASEKFTDSPLIKKTLAIAHAARADFPAAIIELDNALKLDENDVEAHFLMAQMYREMKSFDDALAALGEVEKRNPQYPGLALEQGRVLEFSGNVAKALSAYKKALSQSPDDIGLKLRVGVASHLVGDKETAQAQLLSVLDETPGSPEANFYYGETLRTGETVAESLTYLKKACDLDEQNALYRMRYGLALMAVGENGKAMAAFEAAVKRDSKLAEAYVAMGKIRLIQGGPRDAIYMVEKGLALNPNLTNGYLTVAEAYEQISKTASAVHFYRKAAEADPDNATIQFKLGMVELTVHGNKSAALPFARAVKLVEKSDDKPEWYPEALYRLGAAEKALGRKAAAINAFETYLEVAPENHMDRSEVRANLDELIR